MITFGYGRPATRGQIVEEPQIQFIRLNPQTIPLMTVAEPVTAGGRVEHPAQTGGVTAYVRMGGSRWAPGPQHLAEPVCGDRSVHVQQESCQESAWLGSAEREHLTDANGFDRPQHPEFHTAQLHGLTTPLLPLGAGIFPQ